MKSFVSVFMVTLLLLGALCIAWGIHPVRARGTIYIRADGSIDPPTANITTSDNITYFFTDNIYNSIVVERNNVIVDGADYTLQGSGSGYGFYGSGISNVTMKNTNIEDFWRGIYLSYSSSNSICANNITNNYNEGIFLHYSSSNTIQGNNITANNWSGIRLFESSSNTIQGNNITNNNIGIELYGSLNNSVSGNKITANSWLGILLEFSSDNVIFHNNFIDNTQQAYSVDSMNVWDDGYPSGGNYWSDYVGVDVKSGASQDLPGSDGLGDSAYIIGTVIRDNYPLVEPWSWAPHDVAVQFVAPSKNIVGQGYSIHTNVTATNRGTYPETFNVTLYANTTLIETREVVLLNGSSTTITVTWETSGFLYGNYIIRAHAESVPGETNTVDNTFVYGWVTVTIPGDIDNDHGVDIFDIVFMAKDYGKPPPAPLNLNCDLDGDGDIDIFDLVIAAGNYGDSW